MAAPAAKQPLEDVRRQAKRVEKFARGLAREVAQLEELCSMYGISVVLPINDQKEQRQ